MRLKRFGMICLAGTVGVILACSGPDEKKLKFFNKAKSLYDKGDLVKAALELKNAIQIDPKYADAHYLLGLVELKKGNYSGAFSSFQKSIELNPQNLDGQAQFGRLLLMSKELDKAQEKADLVLKANPGHQEGRILQGAIYLAANKPEQAVIIMNEMLRSGKTDPDIYQLLAIAYRTGKNNNAAEQTVLQGIEKNGKSVTLRRILVEIYTESRQVDKAAAQIQAIMELEPENHSYPIALAGLYWESGQEAKARAVLQELLARSANKENKIIDIAGFYGYHNQFSESEQVLRNAISANNKSFKLRFALSDLYANTSRLDQAEKVLKECLALNKDSHHPQIIETKNTLAKISLARQNTAEAERYVSEVIKASPQDPNATFIRGELSLLRGDGAKAVTAFRTYVNDRPKDLAGYLLLAEAHLLNNEPLLAKEALLQAQKLEPNSRALQKAFSRFYASQKDFVTAERFLREVIARQPNDLETRIALGDMFLTMREYRRAESEYSALKRLAPTLPIGFVKMSELLQAQNKSDKAVTELEQALRVSPEDSSLLRPLVQAYLKIRRYDAAMILCDNTLRKNNRNLNAHLLRSEIFAAQGKYRQAEDAINAAKNAGGDPGTIALVIANLFVRENDTKRARETFEGLVAQQPDNWIAANNYASFLNDKGNNSADFQRAVKLAEKACQLRPENAIGLDTLGWAYYRKGDYRKAEEILAKASAKLPNSAIVNYHLGMTFFRNNKTSQARSLLQKAIPGSEFEGRQEALETLKKL
ncbi:transmembrane and TPR repeat-containing protein 1 [Geobacter sp. OR-1]|uniref:tetratricopeptide repeat protein n=1 Tax=Geobacter sp. OR-1 TaxID=1266765 RepID=UPI0005444748|nr:tetratricopeptide repeat protein [Geobacter sp. OR-1]GAM10708.1 transmembrane and TPR repeat-containing protein 1 [Geobacter sp. OR-1]